MQQVSLADASSHQRGGLVAHAPRTLHLKPGRQAPTLFEFRKAYAQGCRRCSQYDDAAQITNHETWTIADRGETEVAVHGECALAVSRVAGTKLSSGHLPQPWRSDAQPRAEFQHVQDEEQQQSDTLTEGR